MGAQFSRFVIFCRFFVFLGDPSKIAVLPAWELNSGWKMNSHASKNTSAIMSKKSNVVQFSFSLIAMSGHKHTTI